MGQSNFPYRLTPKRERMLERIQNATEASHKSDAIDMAIKHYLEDMDNRMEYWREFTPEQLKLLDTNYMKTSFYPKVRP